MRTETIVVKVRDLKPYLKNPRVNDSAVPKVMKSLEDFGYVNRIVVDRDLNIVAGHTRLKAMLALGWDDREIEVTRYDAPEDKVRAYRIVDNSTQDASDWDYDVLEMEVEELPDYDFTDYGLEFEDDDDSGAETTEDGGKPFDTESLVVIECANEAEQTEIYNEMTERGLKCRLSL